MAPTPTFRLKHKNSKSHSSTKKAKLGKILKIQKNTLKILENAQNSEKYYENLENTPENPEKYPENPEKYSGKLGKILPKKLDP